MVAEEIDVGVEGTEEDQLEDGVLGVAKGP